jgi:hypothetical protein
LPSLGHSLSKRLINDARMGLAVTESKAFSIVSIRISIFFFVFGFLHGYFLYVSSYNYSAMAFK